jgi:hypothetical protein
MIFIVVRKKTAENALAELWLQHKPYRDAISHAANQIDVALRLDPQDKGRSYIGQLRVLLVPPLGVIFRVYPSDRLVRVLVAWHIPLYTTDGFT